MKRFFALLMAALLALGCFAACGQQPAQESEPDAPATSADTSATPADTLASEGDLEPAVTYPASGGDLEIDGKGVTLALVIAGTFGDRSFYDSSKQGVARLAADYGVNVVQIECNNENFEAQMRNAADLADVVVCVGWEFWEIETVAPQYPEVRWIWVDNETSAPIDNVLNIVYAQNEGSFLAGYIAASMSKTGVIGAVGGEEGSDTIDDFIVGYTQGAKYYDESITVEVNYTNSYDDPTKGKFCANALIDLGADVIFQIASAAGDGVFEAAAERGVYAIGVDSDQKYINDAVIICSMKKEVGNSIYDAVIQLLSGNTGLWGTTWIADLNNGYVGIGYGEAGATQQVSDDIKMTVDTLAQKIINGEIVVDTTR